MYLKKRKIAIYPIDHKLKERIRLIKLEKKILEELKGNRDIVQLREEEERVSVFAREDEMVKNIVKGIQRTKSKNTFVIVGINHTKRIRKSLLALGYKAERVDISNAKNIENYLNRIYRYAIQNGIEALKVPPLVPIFILVFKKAGKVV